MILLSYKPIVLLLGNTIFLSMAEMGGPSFMSIIAPLVQVGAVGAVLAWYLVKQEPRMRAIELELQTLSKAVLLNTLANPGAVGAIRDAADELKGQIENRAPRPGST